MRVTFFAVVVVVLHQEYGLAAFVDQRLQEFRALLEPIAHLRLTRTLLRRLKLLDTQLQQSNIYTVFLRHLT